MTSADSFRDAIRAAGLVPPDSIEPGRFHRFPGDGKRNGNTAGWCKLFADARGGIFGDFSTGIVESWQAEQARPMTLAERDGFRAHVERARTEAEAARREEHAKAAERAAAIWKDAKPAPADHAYLMRKGVAPCGVKLHKDALTIPARDADGALRSLQFVAPDGDKRFLTGGEIRGCYFGIGKPNGVLCIAEGYATGASIHAATGHAVAVAFDAGNLDQVARALRGKFPDLRIVLCADDDYRTPGNPGLTKANEAAAAVGGLVAVPDFGAERPEGATDFNDLAQHYGREAVERAIANAAAPDESEAQTSAANETATAFGPWPEPQPLTIAEDEKPYPLAALPDGLREAIAEVVAFVQCPAALAACSALSALSLAGQALANVRRADRLEGPASLYLLAVADSGERKTSCDAHFLQPIREWEREQAEAAKPKLAEHAAKVAAWEERRGGIRARIREAARKGECTDGAERDLAAVERECPTPLRVPSLIHADCTPEALAWALAHGWPSGGVMSSEAGIVFGGHGMSRESVMRNLSLLNALWDGATHRVERRTSDSFTLTGARLTMGLAAQPETVRHFLEGTKGLARGNGFAARFLVAAPTSTQGARPFREAAEWRHLPAYAARLRALLALPVTPDEGDGLTLPVLTMTDDARALWVRFHDEVEGELRPGGDMAEVRDVASKAADNVARLAALFHLYARGPVGQIGADSVAAAAAIVGWHLYQARAFLGEVAAPRELNNARKLDEWLVDYCTRNGASEVERRTIQQRGPLAVRAGLVLDAALVELADAGRVREAKSGKRRLVEVNPALLRSGNGVV